MGTSSSGNGPRPKTPLIPSWIPGGMPDAPPPPPRDEEEDDKPQGNPEPTVPPNENRYKQSKVNFKKFVKSKGTKNDYANRALRDYVKTSGGGSTVLARRMKPSAVRVAQFYDILTGFRQEGTTESLKHLNLDEYTNKGVVDILSSLMDIVFSNANATFENTQDDSITKQSYANTINRIADEGDIDLDNLSAENIDIMTSIFIEETISTRVICDIGASINKVLTDPNDILEVENNVYQIVSGLVRNSIMSELLATRQIQQSEIEIIFEKIYRIAFDSITGELN